MPELPEVETVVRGLNTKVSNKTIKEIITVWDKVFSDGSDPQQLTGKKIKSVTRRAKYIVFNFFSSDLHLISHLRMTGKYLFSLDESEKKFLRCIFKFSDGTELFYLDMRKFGKFDICTDLNKRFSHIGAEPLTDDLNEKYLKPLLQRNKPIKNFLMDQAYIAGLGNIYTDEVLFLSKIHPQRHSSTLTDKEIKLVIKNVKTVLQKAVDNMGTTLSDYRNTDNVAGENQNYLNVYGRNKKACKTCKTEIEKIKLGGRGTHFCPQCQK
jgi:formamidopyrimidine-DNA glycosylase